MLRAVTTMTKEFKIESDGVEFIVIDDTGETVGVYPTQDAVEQEIERCKKDDATWESAKLLVDTAIKAHTEKHEIDRGTAQYWIRSAAEASSMDPAG